MFKKLCLTALAALIAGAFCLAAPALASPRQDKEAKAMALAAAKLIKAKGEAAFAELNQDNRWNKDGVSIFVCDDKGLELVSPAAPAQVGQNFWDYKDAQGRLVTQEEWKLVKTKGKGWMDSMWTKPGESQPTKSRNYLLGVKVGGRHLMVGGYYYAKQSDPK